MLSLQDGLALKTAVKSACLHLLDQRISTARTAMEVAQESANNQEKSSAGDKYETSRAMGQIDRDMNARQLEQAINERRFLESILTDKIQTTILPGSLFELDGKLFFAGAGLGNMTVEEQQIIAVSVRSPLFLSSKDKKTGDKVLVNGIGLRVGKVF